MACNDSRALNTLDIYNMYYSVSDLAVFRSVLSALVKCRFCVPNDDSTNRSGDLDYSFFTQQTQQHTHNVPEKPLAHRTILTRIEDTIVNVIFTINSIKSTRACA